MVQKIGLYQDPRKKLRWVCRWYGEIDLATGKRKRYSKAFELKRDAESFQQQKLVEFNGGQPRDRASETPLHEFCRDWLKIRGRRLRPNTCKLYRHTVNRLVSYFGKTMPVQSIRPIHAERFIASVKPLCGQKLSSWTIHREIRSCRAMFADAVEWDLILKNPFAKIAKPKCLTQQWYYMGPAGYQKLLQSAPNLFWKARYALAYTCGLRFGEVFNLQWSDVDFQRSEIHVINRPGAIPPFFIKDAEARTIPLPRQTFDILHDLQAFCQISSDESPYVCLDERQYQAAVEKYSKYAKQKRAWRNQDAINHVNRELKRHLRKAGIKPNAQFSFHTLRKCAGKNWSKVNRDPNTTKELMGHSSIATTMKYYDQVTEQDKVEAAAAIDALVKTTDAVVTPGS